jgi:hypothetical protein
LHLRERNVEELADYFRNDRAITLITRLANRCCHRLGSGILAQ